MLQAAGATGRQILKDIDVYTAGINAYYKKAKIKAKPWARNDVYAINALAGFIFGRGGGDEVRRSQFLSALNTKFGSGGRTVFDDLRQAQDPETPVTIAKRFPYATASGDTTGNAIVDNGSLDTSAANAVRAVQPRQHASNFLIVGAKRSATGHPLFVAGPQIGYFYPGLTLEMDLHGGGIDARGATTAGFPGTMLIGRGDDFAWSLTSAGSDKIDQYAEKLCGGDDFHYLYKGECRAMEKIDAGAMPAAGRAARPTVPHHRARAGHRLRDGRRQARGAVEQALELRPRRAVAAAVLRPDNGKVRSRRRSSRRSPSRRSRSTRATRTTRTSRCSPPACCRCARRPGPEPADKGTGEFEWKGFLAASKHPQAVDPSSGRWSTGTTSRPPSSARRTTSGPTARSTAEAAQRRAGQDEEARRSPRWSPR